LRTQFEVVVDTTAKNNYGGEEKDEDGYDEPEIEQKVTSLLKNINLGGTSSLEKIRYNDD
jgi:hypothetical protein